MNRKSTSTQMGAEPCGPLSPYKEHYITLLRELGYGSSALRGQTALLKRLNRWLERTGRKVGDLNETVAEKFLQREIKRGRQWSSVPATLRRLLGMLRRMDVTPPAKAGRPTPSQQLTSDYEHFLLQERSLTPPSITPLRRIARVFLSEKFGAGWLKLSQLNASDVMAFVERHADSASSSQTRMLVRALRSFFRYLHYRGLVKTDLSSVVPKVASWSLPTLPKHLSVGQVRQLLRHCKRSTPLGRRNYAILLLLARLGLRSGEVVGLNLEDLDWDNLRITVRGKGGSLAQLPLPADVARAIAQYLKRGRPRNVCRRVFLRHRAPFSGFPRSSAMGVIVRGALIKAGVVSARKGAHLLRHSLATNMLRKAASLDEIGEVLRHKSLNTTAIYAKVDFNALRALALPWPGGVR
jgi:site-specific recombinase XerD